jgi:hypothetical protein
MKYVIYALIISLGLASCSSTHSVTSKTLEKQAALQQSDTLKIVNESLEYEIFIIEPGFNTWLTATARPRGFYTQDYLENRNRIYVIEWNRRVQQPLQFNTNLYELQIDYDTHIDYGYDVNYQLYNYFIYFQLKYNQRLGPFVPRI